MFVTKDWSRFVTLLVFAGAIAMAGCGKNAEPTKAEGDPKPAEVPKVDPKSVPPEPTPPADLTKTKPDGSYTAKAFLAEGKKDRGFPLSQYAGKVIEVTGEIKGYGYGAQYHVAVVILDTGEEITFDTMACRMADKEPWKKALPTQQVVLRAAIPLESNAFDPLVWQIIEVKGTPPSQLSVDEFDRTWAAEPKKYNDKPLFITGVIAKTQEKNGRLSVFLKGQEGSEVECYFGDELTAIAYLSAAQKMTLKPGQAVKILGRYASGQIRDCVLLEPAP